MQKSILNKPTLRSHTHCQVAQKAHRKSQNLSKSMSAPTHWKTDGNKEVLATTKYKNNSRNSSKYEHCSTHKN